MVTRHIFIAGKTGTGKTSLAAGMFTAHEGPAIFCDIQWSGFGEGTHRCLTPGDVIHTLAAWHDGPPPKIRWLTENYAGLDTLVERLSALHRAHHLAGHPLPDMAIFLDEVHSIAPRWADARNPAVDIFTRGRIHHLWGVGITQWPAQTSRLIPANVSDYYIFALWPKEVAGMEEVHHLVVPDAEWILPDPDPDGTEQNHNYWRYNGGWHQGFPDGKERFLGRGMEVETDGDPDEEEEGGPGASEPAPDPLRPDNAKDGISDGARGSIQPDEKL